MINLYEEVFDRKIEHFKGHKNYAKLRESADGALMNHAGFGLDAIHAQDFMNRIVKMPLPYIQDWMDGKNQLEWIDKNTGYDFDSIPLVDALKEGGHV